MSTSVDTAFVRQYEREVKDAFQRMGGFLRPTVRTQDGVVGKSTTFQKIGKGMATTKARHGTITPMNQDHTAIECTLSDFYAGDWVDKLDEAKTKIDERQAIARGGAFALGRKVDDQIFTALDATTTTTLTFTATPIAAIENSLLLVREALDNADAPNDGERYAWLTPRGWSAAMKVVSFSDARYVGNGGGQTFTRGAEIANGAPIQFKDWMGIKWGAHTGLPGRGTSVAKCFAYHKTAVGYATGASAGNVATNPSGGPVATDITWHGDRAAHFVNNMMSGGAVLIDDAGVFEFDLDDTAALPTS